MYVKAFVTIGDDQYEVGAHVDYDAGERGVMGPSWDVGEPDISAPDCDLKVSRATDAEVASFPAGWSEDVEQALTDAYEGAIGDILDARGDYERERFDDDDAMARHYANEEDYG